MFTDEDSRKLIISSLDNNYFVEASAGSGKTTSLVLRMVALVEKGVPVDKICTITFTKAAADEFFMRFQKLLSTRSVLIPDSSDKDLGEKTTESVKLCQEALNNIDLCFLGTIDAFLNMVAHELPNEIKIPSDSQIISEEERMLFIKNQYNKILSDTSNPLHVYALRFNKLFYPSYDNFVVGVEELAPKRGIKIIYDKSLLDIDLDDYLKGEKQDILTIAKDIAESSLVCGSQDNQKAYEEAKHVYPFIKNKNWNDCLPDVAKFIAKATKIKLFPGEGSIGSALENDGIIEPKSGSKNYVYTKEATDVFAAASNKIDNYKHSIFFHVVLGAIDEVNKELKKEGKFNFSDFLYYVTQAFKKSASTDRELVDHVFQRHSYFLLDESQDTDPMQTELFFYITGTKIGNDWSEVEPKEGSLFIVGDPKQSIYGFRGANVQAYLKTQKIFAKKNENLLLTKNFRSIPSLKEWFNKTMDPILNHDEDALNHKDIPIDESDLGDENNTSVERGKTGLKGVMKYSINYQDDYRYIAGLVSELVNNKKYQLLVKNPEKDLQKPYIYRDIRYKDFLIVPRGKNVSKYIAAFNEYNIPLVIEATIPFQDSPSLMNLISLAKLMKGPNNKISYLNLLYSFYKLDESDVINLTNDDYNFDISDISNLTVNEPKYKDIILELNRLYEATKELSFSSTLLYLLNDKGLSLLNKVDSSNLEYTYFLIEKVKEKEEAGLLSSVTLFNQYLDAFVNSNGDEDRVLRFQDDVNRVKIANLHKVKGLQAPIVILNKPRESIKPVCHFVDYNQNPPVAYYEAITKPNEHGGSDRVAQTHIYSEEQTNRWKRYDEAEKDRLQYVAATRAESLLIVSKRSDTHKSYYDPWDKLSQRIDDADYVPKIDIKEPEEPKKEDVNYNSPSINLDTHKESIDYVTPSSGRHRVLDNEDDIKEVDVSDKENATLMGTMVHKLMECIISSKNSYSNYDLLINNILSSYGSDDSYRDMLKDVLDHILKGGFKQLNGTVQDDILTMLMNAKEVHCEVPFSYLSSKGNVVSGVIDCLYLDNNDEYHVIDYKTNSNSDVSILENEYEDQLKHYVYALEKMGIKADAHIYHIKL